MNTSDYCPSPFREHRNAVLDPIIGYGPSVDSVRLMIVAIDSFRVPENCCKRKAWEVNTVKELSRSLVAGFGGAVPMIPNTLRCRYPTTSKCVAIQTWSMATKLAVRTTPFVFGFMLCSGCNNDVTSILHPPLIYAQELTDGDLLTAYTYEEWTTEIVESFDIAPEVRIDAVSHQNNLYAPVSMVARNDSCVVQGGCLEPLVVPPALMMRLSQQPIFDGAFLIAQDTLLSGQDSGDPPRLAFAVRHPACFGPTCPYEYDAPINLQGPWWPEIRFMEFCPVEGGVRSTMDLFQPVHGEPKSLRLTIRGPFGLRPTRDPTGVCVRHDRLPDHVSVDTILRFTLHEPVINCGAFPDQCN